MATRYLINGRPTIEWTENDEARLRLGRLEPICEAAVLSPDDAASRAVGRIRQFYAVCGVGWAVIVVVLFLVGRGRPDSGFFLTLLGIVAVIVTGVAALIYPSKIGNARARVAQSAPPASPGGMIRADEQGLTIEGRALLPWPSLTIATAGMLRMPVRDGPAYYLVSRLTLAASDKTADIDLDPMLLTNARAFLDNVYQRLRPGHGS